MQSSRLISGAYERIGNCTYHIYGPNPGSALMALPCVSTFRGCFLVMIGNFCQTGVLFFLERVLHCQYQLDFSSSGELQLTMRIVRFLLAPDATKAQHLFLIWFVLLHLHIPIGILSVFACGFGALLRGRLIIDILRELVSMTRHAPVGRVAAYTEEACFFVDTYMLDFGSSMLHKAFLLLQMGQDCLFLFISQTPLPTSAPAISIHTSNKATHPMNRDYTSLAL